jgi:hypothetical protein
MLKEKGISGLNLLKYTATYSDNTSVVFFTKE